MTADVLGGPIHVQCIGSVLACGGDPDAGQYLATLLQGGLWIVLAVCLVALVLAGARIAYSLVSGNADERAGLSQLLLPAAAVALICAGGITVIGSAWPDTAWLLTVLRWGLWLVVVVCIITVVLAGGRIARSSVVCDRHQRETKILVGALIGAVVAGSGNSVLVLTTGG